MKLDQLLEQLQQQHARSLNRSSSNENKQQGSASGSSSSSTSPPAYQLDLPSANNFAEWIAKANLLNLSINNQFAQAPPQPNNNATSITTLTPPSTFSLLQLINASIPPTTTITNNQTQGIYDNNLALITPHSLVALDQSLQGLTAIGGCRQCARTFSDRLELIHHFVDHFPAIFYSFEARKEGGDQRGKEVVAEPQLPVNTTFEPINGSAAEVKQLPSHVIENGSPINIWAMLQQQLASAGPLFSNGDSYPPKSQVCQQQQQQPLPDNSEGRKKKKRKNHKKKDSDSVTTTKPLTNEVDVEHLAQPSEPHQKPPRPAENHQDLPYHMCPQCCLTFAELQPFQDHLRTHTIASIVGMENGSGFASPFGFSDPSQQPKAIKCHFCDLRFSSVYRLAEHEKLHAQNCTLCNKNFMTIFDLNLHIGTHTGFTYDCKDCGRCFPCRKSLAEHNKSHRILLSTPLENYSNNSPPEGFNPPHNVSPSNLGANSLFSMATTSTGPTPTTSQLYCLDFSSVSGKKSKPTNPAPIPTAPTLSQNGRLDEPSSDLRPESLFHSNPYFNELLHQNGQSTRKRRSRTGSRRANGEKSRRQTTLVAVEISPGMLVQQEKLLPSTSDGDPVGMAQVSDGHDEITVDVGVSRHRAWNLEKEQELDVSIGDIKTEA